MVVLSVTCEDKKTPLSAEELKEFAQLQNDIELYKAKLRSEFGYSNKDIKAGLELVLLVTSLNLILGNGEMVRRCQKDSGRVGFDSLPSFLFWQMPE